MGYVEGVDRDQVALIPESLDRCIKKENPVRFLDAFIEQLDLGKSGFQRAVPSQTGRPAYHPGDMLRLFLYGYLNRIRSSRLMEREAQRNLELMWLIKCLRPDFKTIADFRKNNAEAIRQVCGTFTLYCGKVGLFGGELIAIDGSKFKAVNARGRNFSAGKLTSLLKEIEEKIGQYMEELDANDRQEKGFRPVTAEEVKQKIAKLKSRRRSLNKLSKALQNSGESQLSLTDADSRSMPVGKGHGTDVSYNVQLSVDSKHKLIVDHQVTNDPTDQGHLSEMAVRSKQILGADRLEVVADSGYYDGQEVAQCVHQGIIPHIPKPNTSANKKLGLFVKADFRYDDIRDCYRCPAGETLTFRSQLNLQGRETRYYTTNACRRCAIRSRCTRSAGARRITRSVDEGILDDMARRIRSHPEVCKRRKGIVEHPFGTIKRSMNQGYFLTMGLRKVAAEMSLTVLAYNFKRVFKILGPQKMIEALA